MQNAYTALGKTPQQSTTKTRAVALVLLTLAGCNPNPNQLGPMPNVPEGAFLEGRLGYFPRNMPAESNGAQQRAEAMLQRVAAHFGVDSSELRLQESEVDSLGKLHLVYTQVHDGLVVEGATLAIHVDAGGEVYAANGSVRDASMLPNRATVTAEAAQATVRTEYVGIEPGAAELVYWVDSDMHTHLAWAIEVQDLDVGVHDRVYVDALANGIVGVRSFTSDALQRELTNERTRTDTVYTESMPPPPGELAETFERMGRAYTCVSELFGRDGIDGNGSLMRARLSTLSDNNARWTRLGMIFGRGAKFGGGLERSDDIVVHEMGHGLWHAMGLASDKNTNSGALHEGLSDILASICQWQRDGRELRPGVWSLAEDIYTPNVQGDALRYVDNPHRDGSYVYFPVGSSSQHEGGGMIRLAFYLTAQGGKHPNYLATSPTVVGIGIEKAAQIYFHAVDVYFTERSQYEDARAATILAARELYGESVARSVATAWDAVGVFDPRANTGADAGLDARTEAGRDAGPQAPTPRMGEVVISEIMYNPKTLSDSNGEWIELRNTTSTALSLNGCTLATRDESEVITAPVNINANGYVTFAHNRNVGFAPTATFAMSLPNTSGRLTLRCGGVDVDTVPYNNAGFPGSVDGAAIQTSPNVSAGNNDNGRAWCLATATYARGNPDRGTPGITNRNCR